MSTSPFDDLVGALTDTCMGPANLDDDELTDDAEEEISGPVATLAELDPDKFSKLQANLGCLEEGEIGTPTSSKTRFQPYNRSLPSQLPDRQTQRNIRGITNETFRQINEARKLENTSRPALLSDLQRLI